MSDNLFDSGFLCMTGHEQFNSFSDAEIENLRRYLNGGGLLFIDDSLGGKNFGFDKAVRMVLNRLFPDKQLVKIPADHAVFRSFYLINEVGGRRIVNNYLEGIILDGRLAVIYSQNDLLGAWARDKVGNWLNECVPGGEIQRLEAMKLTANIIMFSVTGTYKTDAIHQEYIRQKLKQ